MPDVSSSLISNSVVMAFARVVGVLTTLGCVPTITRNLGANGLGLWECLTAVTGFVLVLQVVLCLTLSFRMSVAAGAGETAEIVRLVRVGLSSSLFLAVGVWFLTYWNVGFLVHLFKVPVQLEGQSRAILPWIASFPMLAGVGESFLASCVASQRAGVAAIVQAVGLVIANVTTILMLMIGFQLQALCIGQAFGVAVTCCIGYTASRYCLPQVSWIPLFGRYADFQSVVPFASILLASQLAYVFRDHLDRLVAVRFGSLEAAGYLGIARNLSSSVCQVCSLFTVPLGAAIAFYAGRGDSEQIQKVFAVANRLILLSTGLVIFILSCLHKEILVLWLGHDVPAVEPFLIVQLGAVLIATGLSAASAVCLQAMGRPRIEMLTSLLGLAINVILKFVLVPWWGAIGTVIASGASWCIAGAMLAWFAFKLAKLKPKPFIDSCTTIATTLALCAIGWMLCGSYMPEASSRAGSLLTIFVTLPFIASIFAIVMLILRIVSLDDLNRALGIFANRSSGVSNTLVKKSPHKN